MRHRPLLLISIILASCSDNPRSKRIEPTSFIYPISLDSTKYIAAQKELRKDILTYRNTTIAYEFPKDKKYKDAITSFANFMIDDSGVNVPKAFNLDIKRDFWAPSYMSTVKCIYGKDTLFTIDIKKELFNPLLDSSLKKYGVLYFEDNYNSINISDDSIMIHYYISIPATLFKKTFIFQIDARGHFKIIEERPITMHWQKTGLDQQTSAVVRYQLWFGARPLRLIFQLTCIFSFSI